MPAKTILNPNAFECNNDLLTTDKLSVNDISTTDVLDMLAAMNGEQGYAESLDAWQAWDALTKTADALTHVRMLEACRQFALARASTLRNGAA